MPDFHPAPSDIPPAARWDRLADAALSGEPLSRDDARAVLAADDVEVTALLHAAYRVRHAHFGNRVQLYFLKNAKSGLCPEDCRYCSQAKGSTAAIDKYPMLSADRLLAGAADAVAAGARTYCIVASGRGPTNREVEHVAGVVERIKAEHGLHVCACLGLLKPEQAVRLRAAGVDRINHNLNTGRGHHDSIVSTHSYEDRLNTLRTARDAGLELCSGLIVGLGERDEDLIDAAFELRDLRAESVPVNFLHAIDGTPLEDGADSGGRHLDPRYCLKVLCLYRFALPATEIRIAGGREVNLRSLQPLGLYPANSLFVSDYLTTAGQTAEQDYAMVRDLGFEVVAHGHEAGPESTAGGRTGGAGYDDAVRRDAAESPVAACPA